jgi:tetratricopeptide (TPR) repeat protein
MSRRRFSRILTLMCVVSVIAPATAQEPTHIEGLGSLSFPNSGAAEAQHDFLRGVLLLHSFEYRDAAEAFRKAQEIDPDFALAYWGEAMTYTHPVWNEKDRDAALEALSRYAPTPGERAERAPTERERAYLAAVDVLYGEGEKASLDTLYAAEMEKLAATYPEDLEARTFYALSLLGLSQGDRAVPTYMEAGSIALAAFEENPDHPGAAHYTIHSFDDPTHAVLAMQAARAYASIAPDAAHAQHMTTHIFLARGMWDDVVEANIRADAVVDRGRAARDLPPTYCGHYNEWLMYGYQQQGRYGDAAALLAGCLDQALSEQARPRNWRSAKRSYTYMRNLYLADSRDWDGSLAHSEVDVSGLSTTVRLMKAWGSGVAALHRGDRATAEEHFDFLVKEAGDAEDYLSPYVPVWRGTFEALLLADAGDAVGALRAAREAAEYEASLPVDFGPPVAFKPARELEGELLLAQGRTEEAMAAFSLALARTPNRILSLAGYARAAAAAGRTDLAEDAYSKLANLLEKADETSPEVTDATAFLSARPTSGSR